MKPEEITIDDILEIFEDFLTETEWPMGVFKTKKGTIILYDELDLEGEPLLEVYTEKDTESLARSLLWYETCDYFWTINEADEDPEKCSKELKKRVLEYMQERTDKLPEKWGEEVERFFL